MFVFSSPSSFCAFLWFKLWVLTADKWTCVTCWSRPPLFTGYQPGTFHHYYGWRHYRSQRHLSKEWNRPPSQTFSQKRTKWTDCKTAVAPQGTWLLWNNQISIIHIADYIKELPPIWSEMTAQHVFKCKICPNLDRKGHVTIPSWLLATHVKHIHLPN